MTFFQFEWFGNSLHGIHYPKAMLMLPIQLKNNPGKNFFLLLDTGTPRSMIFKYRLNEIENANPSSEFLQLEFEMGGNHTKLSFKITNYGENEKSDLGEDKVFLGLLGLDFFRDKILFIDFPNQKIGIGQNKKLIHDDLLNKLNKVNSKIENGRIIIESYCEAVKLNLLFDVGASTISILTTKKLWQQLTGKTGDENDNAYIEAPGAEGLYKLSGNKIINPVTIGGERFDTIAYFEKDEAIPFHLMNANGLMGNRLFYDEYVVLIDFISNELFIGKIPQK